MTQIQDDQLKSGRQGRTLRRVGAGAAIAAVAIAAAGIAVRSNATRELAGTAQQAGVPAVDLVIPTRGDDRDAIVLPGNVQAYNSAAIYARTNGYVRRWLADIGDHVGAGQPLAILDAPEVDQQLAQAQADYQTALANQKLARTTSVRWNGMLAQDAVSRQEADEKAGDFAAKSALANAADANVKRLRALQGFTRLSAPFAGVVTSRSAQIGALVTAGNASAQPLFTVSDVHRMRIYVRVPQGYSAQIHPGLHASMTLPEYPGRSFDAVLTRSANAVDQQSGTMLVELQADNADGALKAGAYAQVSFPIANTKGSVRLPASALMFGDKGPTVATVDASGHVHLKRISIGRDDGNAVEVTAGLMDSDRVIDSPPDAISDGDSVRIESTAKAPLPKAPSSKDGAKHAQG